MSKRKFDENGWYEVKDNPISKSGVFQYLGKNISPELEPDRVYNVWRPEEELNNPDTINSFKLVPWIPFHEMLGKDFTPAEEVGVQGTTGEQVYFKDGTLLGNIKVYGEKLANLIDNGIKELSLGFRCLWEITSGVTPDGQSYDVIQRKIRGNHLASVPEGRMGSDVAVMDHSVFALDQKDVVKIETQNNGDAMELEELIAQVKAMLERIEAIEAEMKAKAEAAEDMCKDEEQTAEDMEEDKEKPSAMDSAIKTLVGKVKSLEGELKTIKSTAIDAKTVMKDLAEKNDLASKSSAIIGAFDHSDMDKQGVAKYALEKLGVACDEGHEVTALKAFLQAKDAPKYTVDNTAFDGKDVDTSFKSELGL
jgi:hypothetical protein